MRKCKLTLYCIIAGLSGSANSVGNSAGMVSINFADTASAGCGLVRLEVAMARPEQSGRDYHVGGTYCWLDNNVGS